jgi:hypothetical protein
MLIALLPKEVNMRRSKLFWFIFALTLLLSASLGCKLVTGPFDDLDQLDETAGALSTEVDTQAIETEFQALTTDMGGEFDVLQTEFPDLGGEKPADIPVMEGGDEFLASETEVSYFLEKDFQEVVDFYEREMPVNGWVKVEGESKNEDGSVELVFEKDGRKATVMITDLFAMQAIFITIENP